MVHDFFTFEFTTFGGRGSAVCWGWTVAARYAKLMKCL